MRYTVIVQEFGDWPPTGATHPTEHVYVGLTLARAWRVCRKHARRGVNRFGGSIAQSNWGVRGGQFPGKYRSAVIGMDWQR